MVDGCWTVSYCVSRIKQEPALASTCAATCRARLPGWSHSPVLLIVSHAPDSPRPRGERGAAAPRPPSSRQLGQLIYRCGRAGRWRQTGARGCSAVDRSRRRSWQLVRLQLPASSRQSRGKRFRSKSSRRFGELLAASVGADMPSLAFQNTGSLDLNSRAWSRHPTVGFKPRSGQCQRGHLQAFSLSTDDARH